MSNPLPLPINPVEPDVSATPVAIQIDPLHVLQTAAPADIMWAVPPNTLVFRSQVQPPLTAAGAGNKRRLTVPDPVPACAYFAKASTMETQLIPFGVAIDGNASASESRRWPIERGRLAVSVSGTVTMIAHPDDIAEINVGDRLCVALDAEHDCGLVGYSGFRLPKIVPFTRENADKLNSLATQISTASLAERNKLVQQHRALDYFAVALELGYCEMRVLLTP
jgi:hypothetical protein